MEAIQGDEHTPENVFEMARNMVEKFWASEEITTNEDLPVSQFSNFDFGVDSVGTAGDTFEF